MDLDEAFYSRPVVPATRRARRHRLVRAAVLAIASGASGYIVGATGGPRCAVEPLAAADAADGTGTATRAPPRRAGDRASQLGRLVCAATRAGLPGCAVEDDR